MCPFFSCQKKMKCYGSGRFLAKMSDTGLTRTPGTVDEKSPHNIKDPPPNFTVGIGLFPAYASFFRCKTHHWCTWLKSSILIYFTGPGALVKVNGIMSSTRTFSPQNLVASAKRLKLGHKWIFQQDNSPKHTSKATKKLTTK